MSRIVYVNGEWMPEADAKISVFDRGFQFADSIYEITAVLGGKLIDYHGHAQRLSRSLTALGIPVPVSEEQMLALHREAIARNGVEEGLVYLQVSRGVQDRDFMFGADLSPTFVIFTQSKKVLDNPKWKTGISVITMPDGRWVNRQIKTVQLLYSSLAKMEAAKAGADDAIFIEDGFITEASSSNVHIVTREGTLITRQLSNALLHGITRGSILDLARQAGVPVEERRLTLDEARNAAEIFITSATAFVMPVVRLDGEPVGEGVPGPVSGRFLQLYIQDRIATAI